MKRFQFLPVLAAMLVLISYAILFSQNQTRSSENGIADVSSKYDNAKGIIEQIPTGDGIRTHNAGLLSITIDDVGGQDGWRFTHQWPDTLYIDHLYWNWLAIGYTPDNVSDAWDGDWHTTPGGGIIITEPGVIADEDGYAQFNDTLNAIQITQESYAWANPPDDDYIIVKYTVENIGVSVFDHLYIGHSTDFDVLGDHSSSPTDMSDFDSTRALAYMWDTSSTWHVGVKLLEGNFRAYRIDWFSSNDPWKYQALSIAGADSATSYPSDWCFMLSTGPYLVNPADSVIVAFAFLAGENLSDLQINADRSQEKWNSLGIEEQKKIPSVGKLHIYPNPFVSSTTIHISRMAHGAEGIELEIFDVTGRKVRKISLLPFNFSLGVSWDGRDEAGKCVPPGIYFLKLNGKPVGKVVKVR